MRKRARKLLIKLLNKLSLPGWLKCPRSVWAFYVIAGFLAGYLMGMYEEPDEESGDMVADVRENPINTYCKEGEDSEFGFCKRRNEKRSIV